MADPLRCDVCKERISEEVILAARTRGLKKPPKYCSPTCRNTAAKRRQRDGSAIPRAIYVKKLSREAVDTTPVHVILGTMKNPKCQLDTCRKRVPKTVVEAALSRGQEAKYCSPQHRDLAAKHRQRAGTAIPRADYLAKKKS